MSQPSPAPEPDQRKLTGPFAHVFDVFVTGAFFVFMTWVAYGHTPDFSPKGKLFFAMYTSAALSAVFWLVLSSFRVTLVDMCRRRKAKIPS